MPSEPAPPSSPAASAASSVPSAAAAGGAENTADIPAATAPTATATATDGRAVRDTAGLFRLLDDLFETRAGDWWDRFYADRDRGTPFFVAKPDENLAAYTGPGGPITPGRALDIGCGPGRNALHLAALGHHVDAVDLSATALAWAAERADAAGPAVRGRVRLLHGDVFTLPLDGPYDLIYDSGCFHHLAPHRRISYLDLLDRHLAPGGWFGLSCFAAGEDGMGTERPDAALYRDRTLHGGVAYTPDQLRHIFTGLPLTETDLRRMRDEPADAPYFGAPFLWTALFRRPVTTG